ncbi:peptide-methionine (S)-S-oxide reductase [Bacillus sp. YZJH907-2]|uniref:peptide-methionine (S)-S-oxide reductase n=1 Tax=Halalkalibacter suaedae TaxID=2822140 RepID=A0A940WQI1_9BACI|nr:peptide-methionine (S)-S-oxide reductase [Bacillus suaedae]
MVRTRVGYSGGSTKNPTYRNMGDHTESLEIDYDPTVISVVELLKMFWQHHNAQRMNDYRGRQYLSLLLYRNEQQLDLIQSQKQKFERQLGKEIVTEIKPYHHFYIAEDRHQKYYLKRFSNAYASIFQHFTTEQAFVDSTIVARLNAMAKGFGTYTELKQSVQSWGLSEIEEQNLNKLLLSIKW